MKFSCSPCAKFSQRNQHGTFLSRAEGKKKGLMARIRVTQRPRRPSPFKDDADDGTTASSGDETEDKWDPGPMQQMILEERREELLKIEDRTRGRASLFSNNGDDGAPHMKNNRWEHLSQQQREFIRRVSIKRECKMKNPKG